VSDDRLKPLLPDRTLARQLSGAFVVFGALVAAGFFATAITYGVSWAWLTPEIEQSRLGVRAESASFAAMLDEENGLRGYLMTRDVRFLEPYARGQIDLVRANAALNRYIGFVPELAMLMVSARLAQERFGERWAKAAADTRYGGIAPSLTAGKTLFDAYRTERTAFADALDKHSEALTQRAYRVLSVQVGVVLTLFIVIFWLAVRQHSALHESIVDPVAALLHHIGRVRDGQLEASVDPTGPYELRQLGEGLNDMVRALVAARAVAASRDDALRQHTGRLRQILDASREFSESLNLKYVVGAVRSSTAAVGGYARVIVWLMDDDQKRLVDADEGSTTASGVTAVEMGQGIAGRAAKSGRTTLEGPHKQVRFSDSDPGLVCAIAVPLIVGARVVGALEARHSEPQLATHDVIEILEMLATHAATAIESARLHEGVEERSQMDVLTRLSNRRRLDADLSAECSRCLRYERPLAFVMLDVDHFKEFNDTHGHPEADSALQELAEVISGCVRTTDTAYRYGGEEFCILMRETTAADAMNLAERVRLRIEQRFATGALAGITASLGVAGFCRETPMPRALVEAADAAMYESKRGGRNRVALSISPRAPVAA
jgi:diguanylate cyclase (GGDEF)-like protein